MTAESIEDFKQVSQDRVKLRKMRVLAEKSATEENVPTVRNTFEFTLKSTHNTLVGDLPESTKALNDQENAVLSQFRSAFIRIMTKCVDVTSHKVNAIDRAQSNEDKANMLGYAFNAASIISTYYPVSAGLVVIGTLLTAKSDSAASLFSDSVKRTTTKRP